MERAGLASSLLQPQLLLVSQPTATIELLFCLSTYKRVSFPLVCSSFPQLTDRPAIFARKIALLHSICKHFMSSPKAMASCHPWGLQLLQWVQMPSVTFTAFSQALRTSCIQQ